jgi:alpha-glucosidase
MLLSSGLSGLTLNHADIGGYTTVNLPLSRYHRSRELLYRWIELSAFTPIYRTHEGLAPERNHQVYSDSASIEFFAEFGQLHYALKDYFQQLVRQASDRGIPPIRPLYLHYSQDTTTYELEQQFLMGRDMLVCPVVHKGAKQVRCYLPEAGWTHALTGEVYDEKGWHTIDAPIGQPCVLLRRSGEAFDSLQRVFQKYRPDLNLVE